jgi:hypothetical protein
MKKVYLVLLMILTIISACKGNDTPEKGSYSPLSKEECQTVQAKLETSFNVKFELSDSKSYDNLKGNGCSLEAKGTGLNFTSDTDTKVKSIIGWTEEDFNFAGGGANGSQAGLKNGNKLAIYSVNWEPASDVKCPDDRPISDCEIEPAKQDYIVKIWMGLLN